MPKLKFGWDGFLLLDVYLQYQIIETTYLDLGEFLTITKELLEEADYTTKTKELNKICFTGFASKNDLSRITDGDFEFIHGEFSDEIILTYEQSLMGLIFMMIFISIMVFSLSPWLIILAIPISLQEWLTIYKLRQTGERILSIVADPT